MRQTAIAAGLVAGLVLADIAAAQGALTCETSPADRRTRDELQKDLKSKGWKVRKVQVVKGCYEISGYDPMGRKVEAFFHPRSLERMRVE